jgi:sortase (surface protein transpeptidase)
VLAHADNAMTLHNIIKRIRIFIFVPLRLASSALGSDTLQAIAMAHASLQVPSLSHVQHIAMIDSTGRAGSLVIPQFNCKSPSMHGTTDESC